MRSVTILQQFTIEKQTPIQSRLTYSWRPIFVMPNFSNLLNYSYFPVAPPPTPKNQCLMVTEISDIARWTVLRARYVANMVDAKKVAIIRAVTCALIFVDEVIPRFSACRMATVKRVLSSTWHQTTWSPPPDEAALVRPSQWSLA